ncbi:hypothetical protein Z042_08725 [Chania multitudinisentens RB-25]|uniref:Uncharacterized protein n=1 Tax=Chania multitudinisentens RB-25 TaxID=1441930 RepID=W0LCJ9_9GAMM|nr:hypothetical protein [Chania multitudinisentens]AHG19695.1 hypothetical protein Z042_08725 [Chania multitudinisentens RB-25]
MKKIFYAALLLLPLSGYAAVNDCRSWPESMAEVWLKNQNIVDISQLEEEKTEVTLLASEKKGNDIYTQVFHFTFQDKNGKKYEIITQNDASEDECSASEVNIFLISKKEVNH